MSGGRLFQSRLLAAVKARSPTVTSLVVGMMVAELRVIKISQFSDFGLFSPYKTLKNVPSGDQPTAQGLHRRMIPIFIARQHTDARY